MVHTRYTADNPDIFFMQLHTEAIRQTEKLHCFCILRVTSSFIYSSGSHLIDTSTIVHIPANQIAHWHKVTLAHNTYSNAIPAKNCVPSFYVLRQSILVLLSTQFTSLGHHHHHHRGRREKTKTLIIIY